jgi:hypothetical protein
MPCPRRECWVPNLIMFYVLTPDKILKVVECSQRLPICFAFSKFKAGEGPKDRKHFPHLMHVQITALIFHLKHPCPNVPYKIYMPQLRNLKKIYILSLCFVNNVILYVHLFSGPAGALGRLGDRLRPPI